MSGETGIQNEVDYRMALAGGVSLALTWSWFFCVNFSAAFILPIDPELRIEPLMKSLFFLGSAMGFLLMRPLLHIPSERVASGVICALSATLPVPIAAFAGYAMYFQHIMVESAYLMAFFYLLAGVGFALLITQVVMLFARVNGTFRASYVLAPMAAGIFVFFFIQVLVSPYDIITLAVIPGVASMVLFGFRPLEPFVGPAIEPTIEDANEASKPVLGYLGDFLMAVVFGLGAIVGLSVCTMLYGQGSLINVAFALVGVVIVVTIVTKRVLGLMNGSWILSPLVFCCLLPLVLFSNPVIIVFCIILVFGFTLSDFIGAISLVDLVRDVGMGAIGEFCRQRALMYGGTFVGWALGAVFFKFIGLDNVAFSVFVFAIMAVFVFYQAIDSNMLGDVVIESLDAPTRSSESVERPDVFTAAVQAVSESYSLSARETEVFALLARGRNAQYIAETLVVAKHTAKAHIYHIYQKLAIHSQQELLDIVGEKMDSLSER